MKPRLFSDLTRKFSKTKDHFWSKSNKVDKASPITMSTSKFNQGALYSQAQIKSLYSTAMVRPRVVGRLPKLG